MYIGYSIAEDRKRMETRVQRIANASQTLFATLAKHSQDVDATFRSPSAWSQKMMFYVNLVGEISIPSALHLRSPRKRLAHATQTRIVLPQMPLAGQEFANARLGGIRMIQNIVCQSRVITKTIGKPGAITYLSE
jgi:hypothetical protein